jgi:sugar (pentulose or hexulose) kinase
MSRIPISCGIDLGCTNVKAVAATADGRVVGRRTRPTPRRGKHHSVDADHLFGAIEDMMVEMVGEEWTIASAGVGEGGVLVGADGRAATEALAWFDPRRAEVFRSPPPQVSASA